MLLAIGPEKLLSEQHTDRHRRHEDQCFHSERAEVGERRSRAKAAQPQPRPKIAAPITSRRSIGEDPAVGSFKLALPRWRSVRHPEAVGPDRTCHDEEQRRIPGAEHIEKSDYPRRIGHPRDGEPRPEEAAGHENKNQFPAGFIGLLGCR